jgi:hypothetical protein
VKAHYLRAAIPAGWNNTLSTETNGLLTGTQELILNGAKTPVNKFTINFYTDRGRLLQNQNQNIYGDWNYTTNACDFVGQVLGSVQEINSSKSIDHPKVTLLKTMRYDHQGRLLQIMHQCDNNLPVPIASYQYDELGRVKMKTLGNNVETLANEYNIRNWLTGINHDYCLNASEGHFLGMELSYDFGYTNHYFNGNITGMKWRNKGKEAELRSYGNSYGNFNRLTTGDFVMETSPGTWNNTSKDYTASNMYYDENGNLVSMRQMGVDPLEGNKLVVDDLTYTYFPNSNWLQAETESKLSGSSQPGVYNGLNDFRDVASATDYSYDANGNLTGDLNKSMKFGYDAFFNKQTQARITGSVNSISYVQALVLNLRMASHIGVVVF